MLAFHGRGHGCLELESRSQPWVRDETRKHHLQRDATARLTMKRLVNGTHATGPNAPYDAVTVAENSARFESGWGLGRHRR